MNESPLKPNRGTVIVYNSLFDVYKLFVPSGCPLPPSRPEVAHVGPMCRRSMSQRSNRVPVGLSPKCNLGPMCRRSMSQRSNRVPVGLSPKCNLGPMCRRSMSQRSNRVPVGLSPKCASG